MGEVGRRMANPEINLSIKECEGHVVKYSFVGRVDSQLILVTVNLFLHVHFIHYIHLSFTQYILNIQLSPKFNSSQHSKIRS